MHARIRVGVAVSPLALAAGVAAAQLITPPATLTAGAARARTGHALAYAIAAYGDGRIVAAGRDVAAADRLTRFAVSRYTARGRLDSSFGHNGKVLTSFGSSRLSIASAVALQGDGRIVVAGWSRTATAGFAVARYTARGLLDSSFGSGGRVVTTFSSREAFGAVARAVALQPDGMIVVAGGAGDLVRGPLRFALARYTAAGRLDPTFGDRGRVLTRLGADSEARAIVVQPDGKIVAAGTSRGPRSVFAIARYAHDGRLDRAFGSGGHVLTDYGSWAEATGVAAGEDGTLVVGGALGFSDFAVARYAVDGQLDPSFGQGGKTTTDFAVRGCSQCLTHDRAAAVVLQPDGRVVLGGETDSAGKPGPNRYFSSFALVRYAGDGSLDPTFGGGGKVVKRFAASGDELIQALALARDATLVAAGGGSGSFLIARYTANGRLDRTFGRRGVVQTRFP
jgi:uncharacterized delta-60 repeat protein